MPGKKTNENRPSYLRYCHLWNDDDTLVIIPSFDYSIYRYSGNEFITSWRFDFGENNMPENLLQGRFQDVSRRLIQDQKSVQMLDRWTENSDWITFEAAGKPVWWNKQEQKAYLPGNGWEVPYSVLFLFAPYDYWEGKYYTIVSAGNLINGVSPLLSFEPYLKKYPFLRQLEKLDLNESDNDILVEILMK